MKIENLMDNPPVMKDDSYVHWMSEESIVMGWLWHNMEPHMGTTIECCDFLKTIW